MEKELKELTGPILNSSYLDEDANLLNALYVSLDSAEIKSAKDHARLVNLYDYIDEYFENTESDLKEDKKRLYSMVLKKLAEKISAYEDQKYPHEPLGGVDLLKSLMEDHELKQKDLIDEVGSQGYLSEILRGKRKISVGVAKRLGKKFCLDPSAFLELDY